jgi:hypothetical protein
MTEHHDRRAHADAVRRQNRGNQAARWRRQAGIMLASIALGAVIVPSLLLSAEAKHEATIYRMAQVKAWFAQGAVSDPTLTIDDNIVPTSVIIERDDYRASAEAMLAEAIGGALLGLGGWIVGAMLMREATERRRDQALRDRIIGGTMVTSEAHLAQMTHATGPALHIGSVTVPANLETRHMAMIGTTGSGKTTALRQLLDGIEQRGEPALVYDTSGEFIAHYYQPDRGDIILNPFDARCAFWTPFAEIGHPADADRIAHQLISETGKQDSDVWLDTSRILVANMIRALWRDGNGTLPALLNALQDRTKDDLKLWLAGSSSARTFADDADRATGSVLFMLSKAANLIQFLRTEDSGGKPFAFRDFIHGLDTRAGPKPWIFVPRKEDFFEASKPLLACWLECAASAVLGLPPSPDRRIWFVLDELADLPRVDNLARLLPEGRKFGAAVILTFQAVGQMRHRYGPQIAESMLGCCNTKLFLQTIDAETRGWASDTIGECEVEIHTMTDALAESGERPRTTLSKTRKMRPAVLESELRLPKFEGFLLFPDGFPVARIRLTADHLARRGPARQPGFIAGDPAKTLWHQASKPAPPAPPPASTSEGPV